jgi:BirA family transcriptional regulator, biotin operon repressor / biotin---[acetyl-CoA-carboxylase] ligase
MRAGSSPTTGGRSMGPRYQYDVLGSTQTTAVERARMGVPAMTRFVARRQTDGRGRLDHPWDSPDGNLHLSVVVPEPGRVPTLFPLAVGAELAYGLEERFSVHPVLKWPNDLLVPGSSGSPRKLAGILVDRVEDPVHAAHLVVGIGVNVGAPRSSYAPELADRVAILAELVRPPPSVDDVEAVAAASVERAAAFLRTAEGADRALERCRRALYGVGRRVLVDGMPAGILQALGDDGALWVGDEASPVAVRAGDLTVLEEA